MRRGIGTMDRGVGEPEWERERGVEKWGEWGRERERPVGRLFWTYPSGDFLLIIRSASEVGLSKFWRFNKLFTK